MAGAAVAGAGLVASLERSLSVSAASADLHAFPLPWSHNGLFGQLDTAR